MTMTQQEFDRKNRELTEKILDRAAIDANFRKQLVDNPQQALQSAGLAKDNDELVAAIPAAEVTGHGIIGAWTLWYICQAWTYYNQCILKQQ